MNRTFDTIAGCLFLVVGAFFVWGSMGISRSSYGSTVGPNVFPFGLGCILILLAIVVIAQARRSGGAAQQKGTRDYRRFGLLLLATIVYVAVFESLGYVISTFLYLVGVFQVMERKKLLVSIGIAAFFSCCIYYVYVSVFQGTLPPFPDWLGITGN
jgi:putative tricarboxylic transport membrane protein